VHIPNGGVIWKVLLLQYDRLQTAERLPMHLLQDKGTFLKRPSEANLLLKIKEGLASLFDARAIFYRNEKHINHFKVGIAYQCRK